MALSRVVSEIFNVDLETRLGVTQGHRKLSHPIRHPRLPINVP